MAGVLYKEIGISDTEKRCTSEGKKPWLKWRLPQKKCDPESGIHMYFFEEAEFQEEEINSV